MRQPTEGASKKAANLAYASGCTLVLFVFPNFPKVLNLWLFDSPMVLFEIVLSLLLLFRGLPATDFAYDQP